MRRMKWVAAIVLCVSLIVAGCGTKTAESVVKDLDKLLGGMESYKGKGTMTLHTGQQPLNYEVEVWYQKPDYYRIALTNAAKDITQIVLRNEEGVFVLTPKLKKSFRFQSDWPQNQGQVYLYQTLVQSILLDNSRQFAIDKESVVFDVMANYQNGSLARQKIWLDQKTYAPQRVEVSDSNANVMVQVVFDSFDFDPKFDEKAFDMAANMGASAPQDQPSEGTMTPESGALNGGDGNAANDEATDGDADDAANEDDGAGNSPDDAAHGGADDADLDGDESAGGILDEEGVQDEAEGAMTEETANRFVVMEPSYYPEGVSLKDMADNVKFGANEGVLMRFTGLYNYTLFQTMPEDVDAALVPGVMVDLGHTWGLLTGEEQQTLTWTYQGYEYRLTSSELPEDEMRKIAQSVMEEMNK